MERIKSPLNWGSVDKCILAASLTLPFVVSYVLLARYLLAYRRLVPYLDFSALRTLVPIVGWVAVAWAMILLGGLVARRYLSESALLVHATIQLFALSNAFFLYYIGPYTSPLWIVVLGAGMVGFLLFERRAVLAGMATVLIVLGGTTVAERAGYIPYAPLLATHPYLEPSRRPAGSWLAYVGSVSYAATVILWILFAYIVAQWRGREARFKELSVIDELTLLSNRRHFLEIFQKELERAERYGKPLACVILDLDHFKRVNDRYGHPAGDQVLQAVANILKKSSRPTDVVARYGGEEFALLLPETDAQGARLVTERYRRSIEAARVFVGKSTLGVTASVGVACFPCESTPTMEELIHAADDALYQAKQAGRNRVMMAM